jgi:hypothetical protein
MAVYAVRVREGFKGEIRELQAELQLERERLTDKSRKVTEGEIMELMLDALKAARHKGKFSRCSDSVRYLRYLCRVDR